MEEEKRSISVGGAVWMAVVGGVAVREGGCCDGVPVRLGIL